MKSPRPGNRSAFYLRSVIALALGLLIGVVGHYMIYRLSLPSKPFIYVAF